MSRVTYSKRLLFKSGHLGLEVTLDPRLTKAKLNDVAHWLCSRYEETIHKFIVNETLEGKDAVVPLNGPPLKFQTIDGSILSYENLVADIPAFRTTDGKILSYDQLVATAPGRSGVVLWDPDYELKPPPPSPPLSSQVIEDAFYVASYIAAAGVGGVIGNRADAMLMKSAHFLIEKARSLWRSRQDDNSHQDLTPEEASLLARAALLDLYPGQRHDPDIGELGHKQLPDGEWQFRFIYVEAGNGTRWFVVYVPRGDPSELVIRVRLTGHEQYL